MRIQHNIMAMNAYRNYNNNTSALAKNLEKLSSGYRINRAGDDAAGLAISEKMRAQITALGTASKNVKDGISLVKTAEGATQEIHDMLNRMVDLATQSANGTYQDAVDRDAIQEEYEALKTEINRIADASNFNGIKLLDGSLDAGGDTKVTTGAFKVNAAGSTTDNLPAVGNTLGTDTVLHEDGKPGSDTTTFSVDLHNVSVAAGGKIEIAIGTDKITVDNTAGTAAMDAKAIVDKIAAGDGTDTGVKIGTDDLDKADVEINGSHYAVTADGTRLTFTQRDDDTTTPTVPADVSITDPDGGTQPAVADVFTTGAITPTGTTGNEDITVTVSYNDATGAAKTKDVTFKSGATGGAHVTNLITALNADADLKDLFTAAGDATGITMTSKTAGANLKVTGFTTKTPGANDTLTFTPANFTHTTNGADPTTVGSKVTGQYNKSTTVIQSKSDPTEDVLASTTFKLTDDMVADGSTITIGEDTYTFSTDAKNIGKEGYVVYNKGDSLTKIAEKLTDAAADNATYTVGHQGADKITVTEVKGQTKFDLTTKEGIEKSLGFTTSVTTPVKAGGGLTLQIGEDSESYNQLNVSIKDMHTKALGLNDVNLDTQTNAQAAVKVIKDAINQVSTTRGRLGATQNRLEHTANNLSTMKENIQDAEATIRDTDIAEEMMAYTKNNILVQSAQAMLAQANQIPQGVLQLLG